MVPSLALEAPGWLFFNLVDVDPVATDGEPVSNGPVGNVSIDNGEDEMGSLLSRGLSIDFADFFPVSLVVWINIEGDIITVIYML